MALELIAIRLHQPGLPELLLNTLAVIFNTDTAFHYKNMHRMWDKAVYEEKLGDEFFSKDMDNHGWLLNFINIFGIYGGFDAMRIQLEQSNDINSFCVLLKPLAACSCYFNTDIMTSLFEDSLIRIYEFIKKLEGEDFKDKNVGKVFDLLFIMKKICSKLCKFDIENFHSLHLSVVLNMLKYSHFNSKMNSLKEVSCFLLINNNRMTIN